MNEQNEIGGDLRDEYEAIQAREADMGFECFCIECGDSIGFTTCEITATSMAVCQPCQEQD